MLQEILKEATKDNHDTLEQLMYVHQIMSGELTLQQYQQILTTNYLVHQQFEAQLVNGLSETLSSQLDMPQRHKLQALQADMDELHIQAATLKSEPVTFNSEAEILGALYVLEGATLGGNVIVKRLKVNPILNELNLGFHYYQVYGESLIPNWKKFVEVLNQQPEGSYEAAVTGAKKMFAYIASTQKESISSPLV